MSRTIPFQIRRVQSFSYNSFLPGTNNTALTGFFALQDSVGRLSSSLFTEEDISGDTITENTEDTLDNSIFIQNFIARIMIPLNVPESAHQRMAESQLILNSQKYQEIDTDQLTCSICTEDFKQKT